MGAATPEHQDPLIEQMKQTYAEMFGAPDEDAVAAIERRVRVGVPIKGGTPDKVIQVLERLGWPI